VRRPGRRRGGPRGGAGPAARPGRGARQPGRHGGERPVPRARPVLRRAVPGFGRAPVRDGGEGGGERHPRRRRAAGRRHRAPAADRRGGRDPSRRPLHGVPAGLQPGRGVPEGVRRHRRRPRRLEGVPDPVHRRGRGRIPGGRQGALGGGQVSTTSTGTPSSGDAVTRAEICAVACAEAWRDAGEVMVSPFGTIPALGARLAKLTFSPDLVLTDGEAALMVGAPPIGTPADQLVREAAMPYRTVFDVVWSGRRHIMMMASQIDRTGNQNLSAIGDWAQPKVQHIGVRGAPGNSVNHPTSYWVPDHTRRTFVAEVDMVSGIGYARAAEAGPGASRYHDIRVVVSNLGVFDFETPDRTMRLRSVHPGVTVEQVVEATAFELAVPDDVPESRQPTDEELDLMRRVLDPRRF